MFMSYIPKLEETLHAVVNLLLASRIGLKEVPEQACVSALQGIEGVIQGIKMVMLKEGSV